MENRCPDKTSGDKTSGDKTSVDKTSEGTKRPWGQNVRGDKTSVATKRPSDKTSMGIKGPSEKTSVRTKRPWGQNVRGLNVRLGHIYQGLVRQFLLIKIYWAWRKNPPIHTHTLSLVSVFWGSSYLSKQFTSLPCDIITMHYTSLF